MILLKIKNQEILTTGIDDQDDNVFGTPPTFSENCQEYDSRKKPEDDEWFFIDLTEAPTEEKGEVCKEIIREFPDMEDGNLIQARSSNYEEIIAIIGKNQENGTLLFQRIYPAKIMTKTKILTLERDAKIRELEGVTIKNDQIDAAIVDEKLYFKSFKAIKPIFQGIDIFYRIATDEELEKFTGNDMFSFGNKFSIKERNRKAIAQIVDSNILEKNEFESWSKYASNHNVSINTNDLNKEFLVNNNSELTTLLKILLECYYKGEVTHVEKEAIL